MKKVLIILGVVFLVIIGFVAALLIWAGASGSSHQEAFFAAVESGDSQKVIALFDPALKAEVDEPVLSAWMATVKTNLGKYQGLSKTDFNTSSKYENSATITQSSGTVNFEKGQAKSELVFRDGLLVKFNIKSDQIPKDWFKGPAGAQLYHDRGQEFLTKFLSNQPEAAYKMMHPALQEKMPMDKLAPLVKENCDKAGKLKSVTFKSESYDPVTEKLTVCYSVECDNVKTTSIVKFGFDGMKGHLIAFDLSEKD